MEKRLDVEIESLGENIPTRQAVENDIVNVGRGLFLWGGRRRPGKRDRRCLLEVAPLIPLFALRDGENRKGEKHGRENVEEVGKPRHVFQPEQQEVAGRGQDQHAAGGGAVRAGLVGIARPEKPAQRPKPMVDIGFKMRGDIKRKNGQAGHESAPNAVARREARGEPNCKNRQDGQLQRRAEFARAGFVNVLRVERNDRIDREQPGMNDPREPPRRRFRACDRAGLCRFLGPFDQGRSSFHDATLPSEGGFIWKTSPIG